MDYTLIENYINATNTHNFDNLIPLIIDTAVYQFTDKRCVGVLKIKEYFELAWEYIKNEKYSASEIVCIVSTEDIRVYTYNYHYEGYHNNEFLSGGGKATNIFQLIGNEWKLILEHLN